mgnify:CR=1 FL=1
MNEVSEQGAYLQLAQLCARSEHCQHELVEKMTRWGLSSEAQTRIMRRLVSERYVDDERYARAFVNDKVMYNKWGRRKVEQALWQKGISDDIRQRVLADVSDEQYAAILRSLLQQKRRTTSARSEYELNQKLTRFALQRGFTYDIIRQCLGTNDNYLDTGNDCY